MVQKRKILIFSLVYYPVKVGGAEGAIKDITDRLPTDKYEFHMICNRYDTTFPKTEQIGDVTVHRIGIATHKPEVADFRKLPLHLNKILYQRLAFWHAKQLHTQEQFDGIWAMMAHATGVPAGKFKRSFPNVKYLLTLQEGDPPEYIERKMRWFGSAFTDAFRLADTIQVISSFLGRWATRQGFLGVPVLVPNAVNTAHFTQTYRAEELQAVRREFGVAEDDTLIVTTSRLVHKNAVDDVIRALPELPAAVKFVVFGGGPDEPMLRVLTKELSLEDRVLFQGHIDHAVMPKYLKACDIFTRPSRSEGMGNSFVEAMAAELPVVATQEGGIADFLFDEKRDPDKGTTGWAVDADSPSQIAAAMKDIMTRPEKVAEVTARAKAMAIKQYDWEVIAKRMDQEVFTPLFAKE